MPPNCLAFTIALACSAGLGQLKERAAPDGRGQNTSIGPCLIFTFALVAFYPVSTSHRKKKEAFGWTDCSRERPK